MILITKHFIERVYFNMTYFLYFANKTSGPDKYLASIPFYKVRFTTRLNRPIFKLGCTYSGKQHLISIK